MCVDERYSFFLEDRTIFPWSRWKTESSHIHCALFHLVLFIVRIVVFIFRPDKSALESDYRRVVPGLVCKLLAVFRSCHISREFPCNLRNLHSRNNTNANQDLLFLFQVSDKFVPTIENRVRRYARDSSGRSSNKYAWIFSSRSTSVSQSLLSSD